MENGWQVAEPEVIYASSRDHPDHNARVFLYSEFFCTTKMVGGEMATLVRLTPISRLPGELPVGAVRG